MRNSATPPPAKKIHLNPYAPTIRNIHPKHSDGNRPQILFITSYPPRECGIATYSQDLIKSLNDKFEDAFKIRICALENETEKHKYPKEVKYVLNTQHKEAFHSLANVINLDNDIELVVLQHEFGFFADSKAEFIDFLKTVKKTKSTVFHTVLPNADEDFKSHVNEIIAHSDSIIVMTERSATILRDEYNVPADKISVIPHGTHLVAHTDKAELKEKYGIGNRKVLSTFGLLGPGKSIETTLDALADVIKTKPDILFLVIGKTHPGIVKNDGEKYREFLEAKVRELHLEHNVKFINKYLGLDELLEYLQLTDIYLFTSKDPNQAVSGTFSYAASCGCAIIATPIPHAVEFLSGDCGIVVDFENSQQLSQAINKLLFDVQLRETIKGNALHKIMPTAWENTSIAHAQLFSKITGNIKLKYKKPAFNLKHIKKMTTDFGMIQFSKLNRPDRESGYTIDDNARAMISMCQHYALTRDESDIRYIKLYLDFIAFCQQGDGTFLNYVDYKKVFTQQNFECNLEDSNGRTIWALGYLLSVSGSLPDSLAAKAEEILEKALPNIENIYSTRAMAFIIKGLYYYNLSKDSGAVRLLVRKLADRLAQMYLHEASPEWQWFESYLTYANSLLPEALLLAHLETGDDIYKDIAHKTFDFLLSQTFNEENDITVISNQNWYVKGEERNIFGEQPIDVAYTIMALELFAGYFKDESYLFKMRRAFEWFLGRNHLGAIIYNPLTGGCYDGLEETNVNLNQGAESTVSYLLARACIERDDRSKKARVDKVISLKLENYAFKA